MANCGSAVVKTGGGGIACLLRQFETHIDAGVAFERPPPMSSVRSGSIRGQRNGPKAFDLAALESGNRSNQIRLAPRGNKLTTATPLKESESIVETSSEPLSSLLSLSSTSDRSLSTTPSTVEDRSQTPSEELNIEDDNSTDSQQVVTSAENDSVRESSMDEIDQEKISSSLLINPSELTPKASVSTPDETNQPATGEREAGCPALETDRALVTGSDPCNPSFVPISGPSNSGSNTIPMVLKDSKRDKKIAMKEKAAGNVIRTRFVFKQSSKENQNATVYLDDTSSYLSTSNKVKQLARSMDNLCSNSAATPTKELNTFYDDECARNEKWNNHCPSTAPAEIPSRASKEKTPVRSKKPPPPPVPKKNLKVNREVEGQAIICAADQSEVIPHVDESQTSPDLNQSTKPSRPTTLFPEVLVGNYDGDDNSSKSLPITGKDKDARRNALLTPVKAQKNTLFPCNRQKNRGRIVSAETGKSDDSINSSDHDFSPALPYRNSLDLLDNQSMPSPVSLGTRTPPDIDSFVDSQALASDEGISVSNLSPVDQSITEIACTRSDHSILFPIKVAAKTDVDDSERPEAFHFESFLSETFDFLSSSNTAESETNTSPLKSWTDTWCRALQKRLSITSDNSANTADGSEKNCPKEAIAKHDTVAKESNKAPIDNIKSCDVDENMKGDNKSSEEDGGSNPMTQFGVVLRKNGEPSSMFRRSCLTGSFASKSNTRPESFISRPSMIRKSTENFRASDRASSSFNLNRKPSTVSTSPSELPLTILPSQRKTPKIYGKTIGVNSNLVSDRSEVEMVPGRGTKKTMGKNELEMIFIDRAFDFLDDSGA